MTMASLQQTLISIQSKTPPSSSLVCRSSSPRTTISFSGSGSGSFPSFSLSSAPTTRPSFVCRDATAASSYAAALLEIAAESDAIEATCADLAKLEKIFTDDPEVVDFFSNPTLDEDEKRELVEKVGEAAGFQKHTVNLLYVLIDERRMDIVEDVVKEFELVYNELTDTELAVVTSVVPLEANHLAEISKQVQKMTGATNIKIKSVIDPSLVAGFTIRYGLGESKLIDMSVKKQLDEIASQLELNDIDLVA